MGVERKVCSLTLPEIHSGIGGAWDKGLWMNRAARYVRARGLQTH